MIKLDSSIIQATVYPSKALALNSHQDVTRSCCSFKRREGLEKHR